MTLLLSQKDLIELLNMKDAISTVENVFRAHGEGKVVMPSKITLDLGELGGWPGYNAFVNAMPAYIGNLDIAGIKWAGGFWENPEKGLPPVMATIILNNPRTGLPLALMDGAYITALRTGAVTAVGGKYLARKGSSVVGLVGAGTQARFQLEALNEVFNLREVRVTDRNMEAASKYVNEMREKLEMDFKQTNSVREAVIDADIIVTATTSKEPFLRSEWLKSGSFISAIGSYQEVHDEVPKKADKVVVDNLDQVKHRGGIGSMFERGHLTEKDIHGEMEEIVVGKKKGRETDDEIILLVPIGMGSEDVAVAYLALKRAEKEGLGQRFAFF